jgi:hypothetical protein
VTEKERTATKEHEFLNRLDQILKKRNNIPIEEIYSNLLSEWNRFYYCKPSGSDRNACSTRYRNADYFSEFHIFWEKNHEQILGLRPPDPIVAKEMARPTFRKNLSA